MPLYELYRLAKGKHDSEDINSPCGTDHQSSPPENDFFELVWENGQISMHGQSSRGRKSPTRKSLPSHSPKTRDKDLGYGTNTNMGKFGDFDSGLNELPMSVPSAEADLGQDEDMIPWLTYTMDDSLQHEYGSTFLPEISGVTVNELPASNNLLLPDKKCNCNQVFRDSDKNSYRDVLSSELRNISKGSPAGEVDTTRPKANTSQLCPPSQQCQTSLTSIRSRVSDMTENNTSNATHLPAPCEEITQIPSTSNGFSDLKMLKQDSMIPSNSSTIMNFSHFARPAAIVRANLRSIGLMSGLPSARSESMGNKNKEAAAISSNPPDPTLIDSNGECPKELNLLCQQVMEPSKSELKQFGPKSFEQNAAASKQPDPAYKEDAFKDDQTSNQVLGESCTKGQTSVEKGMEPVVASSSLCSGNGMERGSDSPNENLKRKSRETEESDCHSEDVEEESIDAKMTAPARGTGSKRSRAAEVHNLSERRRRDRINEKMRALQELIPNCNKVDKASMLDEAIEYLKTLQLQVQIMSMGAGLYMPPMMLPPAMQHMHAPQMAPFPPMGVGMQMGFGMGYGMGMPGINGGSSSFPTIQVPQMQAAHLPVSYMSGPAALHGMARSNPQMFGLPGRGFPMPMPRAPMVSLSGGPLMNSSAPGLNACGSAGFMETVDLASASGFKDPMQNVKSQVTQSTGASNSTSQMSTQCEATNVGVEQSALLHNGGRVSGTNDCGAVNSSKEDNLVIGKDSG